jgi:hypothetical protein
LAFHVERIDRGLHRSGPGGLDRSELVGERKLFWGFREIECVPACIGFYGEPACIGFYGEPVCIGFYGEPA